MSIFSCIVLCTLCLLSLCTSSIARDIGFVNKLPQNGTSHTHIKNPKMVEVSKKNAIPTSEATLSEVAKDNKLKVKSKYHHHHHHQKDEQLKNHNGQIVPHTKGSQLLKKSNKFHKVVSWRVPRKKKGFPETGFNLDYAPPKVHPPTHN